jgi:hypothetical protein
VTFLGSMNWIGSLPTWIILIMGVLVAFRVTRGGAGSAVSELAKANEILTKRKDELGGEVRDLKEEVARLQGRTDIAAALVPISTALEDHEQRAAERHAAHLGLLELIAARLGPDPEKGGRGGN